MTVSYNDRNKGTDSTQLVTEELQVTVKSLLGQDAASVEIKDIKGPLSLPENTGLQILLVIVFLLLVLLGVAGFLYWQKKSSEKNPVEVQLRPEEIALQELERLLAENLLARGEIKLFHLRISDILRHYIENRFGYQAPERTTEEFLTELSQARSQKNTFPGNHKTLLADFLTHCDLVKFAKHEPTVTESEKTVSICREFIEKTKEKGERE
jgi:cell division protein YceG involved in septum cleavage